MMPAAEYKGRSLVFITCVLALAVESADARVTRFVVEQKTVLAQGAQWGKTGAYEKLLGTAYLEVDPHDPLNAVIVNLDKAPRNSRGRVELSSPFVILKPLDMARGNRKLWYGVNNRGRCIELASRAFPPLTASAAKWTCNPASVEDVGANNTLLTEGFVWVDAGWHGDGTLPPGRSTLFPSFPVAKNSDGSSIVGAARLELQTLTPAFSLPFMQGFRPYEAADTATSRATLAVRDWAGAPKTLIPAHRWAFASCPDGPATQVPSRTSVCLFDGFVPRKLYEVTYLAQDPIVMGLAYVVTRDVAAFLRNQMHDEAGNRNPLAIETDAVGIRRAYVSGTSSTGMYLREFLYLGFNEDEAHRRVFDGAVIYSAGSHRLFANVQFAHPTVFSAQDKHRDYTANSIAPFTFAVTTDPITGLKDGILKRPLTDPHVLQMDEELVFWQWKASLNVVDAAGGAVPIPDNVRLYYLNGWGHVSAAGLLSPTVKTNTCLLPTQGDTGIPLNARAMVKIIDDWVDRGRAPPPSTYPAVENKTLVSLAEYRRQFPKVPGLEPPLVMNELTALDFGSGFTSRGGIQSLQPPRALPGRAYRVLVPRPGPNGDGVGGIDTIWTRAPLGTNVGWNVQTAPRQLDLCGLHGSYVPLAMNKAQRLVTGDSRLSFQERYLNPQGFVAAVRKAAGELVSARFMLQEDATLFIEAARSYGTP